MKYIEVDEDLYRFIAGKTERIGESASDILRRLLDLAVERKESGKPESIHEPGSEFQEPAPGAKVAGKTENYAHIKFARLFNDDELRAQKAAVGRFLFVLSRLYETAPSDFTRVLRIKGRGRLYFATSKEELLESSQSSNPKQIGGSGYWVVVNNNTPKKRTILNQVLQLLGCENDVIKRLSCQIWGQWLNEDGTPKVSPKKTTAKKNSKNSVKRRG